MSNEFLQRVYESQPGKWKRQFQQTINGKGIWVDATAGCPPDKPQRLRPILPEGLPEPPEEAFLYGPKKGGIYLYYSPYVYRIAASYWSGWVLQESEKKVWLHRCDWPARSKSLRSIHCILDLSDPNSRAILETNGLWPGEGEPNKGERTMDKIELPGIEIDPADPEVYDALMQAGWMPKQQRDEWVTLADCDIELADGFGGWDRLIPLRGERHLMALVYAIAKDGPGAVRVRRWRPTRQIAAWRKR